MFDVFQFAMNDHSHDQHKPAPAPVTPDDAGSQARARGGVGRANGR